MCLRFVEAQITWIVQANMGTKGAQTDQHCTRLKLYKYIISQTHELSNLQIYYNYKVCDF